MIALEGVSKTFLLVERVGVRGKVAGERDTCDGRGDVERGRLTDGEANAREVTSLSRKLFSSCIFEAPIRVRRDEPFSCLAGEGSSPFDLHSSAHTT